MDVINSFKPGFRVIPAGLLLTALGLAASGNCAGVEIQPSAENENPFFSDWQSPHGIPDFGRIKDEHFYPAFEAGVEQLGSEIAVIRDNPEPPTFTNTVEALESAGSLLDRVKNVFRNLGNTNASEFHDEMDGKVTELLADRRVPVYLDEALYQRVKTVYEQKQLLGLDEQALRLLELKYRGFLRSGISLDAENQDRLRAINTRISQLGSAFEQNLLAGTKEFKLLVSQPQDLAGIPALNVESARAFAQAQGYQEGWLFGLNRSRFENFMSYSENRDLRRQMYQAYTRRAGSGSRDNREILLEIVRLRAERASLLGYENHAQYELSINMAGDPQKAAAFLYSVWNPAKTRAAWELIQMQAIASEQAEPVNIEPWDWWFYAQKLREREFALDADRLRPYFELGRVREGAFTAANRLFGVRFVAMSGVTGWHPTVQTWEVFDAEGNFLGVFMADYYSRKNKRGGSWKSTFQSASNMNGKAVRPIVTNNFNFTPPADGNPTLLNFRETQTLFHELGHALHSLMSTARYTRIAGSAGSPRDYTEFPAQFMEHYASDASMLSEYARHFLTGEAIPDEMIKNIQSASTHNQGFKTVESVAAAWLDLRWHTLSAEEAAAITDVEQFEQEAFEQLGLPAQIGPRYRSTYFAHIFARGYSSEYYAYLWAETLDADAFSAFVESGNVFEPNWARRLKENIYQAGGLEDAEVLYRKFRGRDPEIDSLLKARGLPRVTTDDG